MANRKYHSLLVRDNATALWGVHFGAFSRADCNDERDDLLDHDVKRSNTKIIATAPEQTAIDASVAKLNRGEG